LFSLYLILLLLVLSFKVIKSVNQQVNVVHVVNAKRLSNTVYFDSELLFQTLTFATFKSSVVNQVVCLFNQHPEHVLRSFILESNVGVCTFFTSDLRRLLVVEFRLRSVSLIRTIV
jgi:hypothetical protein